MNKLRRLLGASSKSYPTGREVRPESGISRGLAPRMALASSLLLLLVGAAFAVLLIAISNLRASEREVANSREANAAADRLEELVIDLETGVRGFVITRQERFLEPWTAARAAFPARPRRWNVSPMIRSRRGGCGKSRATLPRTSRSTRYRS